MHHYMQATVVVVGTHTGDARTYVHTPLHADYGDECYVLCVECAYITEYSPFTIQLSQKVSMLTIELEEGREKALSSEADSKKTIGSLRKGLEEAKAEKKVIEEEKLVLEDQIHYLKDEIEQAHEQTSQVRRECAEKDSRVSQLNR